MIKLKRWWKAGKEKETKKGTQWEQTPTFLPEAFHPEVCFWPNLSDPWAWQTLGNLMCTPHFILGNLIVIETIVCRGQAVEGKLSLLSPVGGLPQAFMSRLGLLAFTNLLLVLRLGPFPNIIAFFFFSPTNKSMFRPNIHALKKFNCPPEPS